jgi:hypothetical protein
LETLAFFRCQSIYAPNPQLHTPRLLRKSVLESIPENWHHKRLLYEPTYLLWAWHQAGVHPQIARDYRRGMFKEAAPSLESLQPQGSTIFN